MKLIQKILTAAISLFLLSSSPLALAAEQILRVEVKGADGAVLKNIQERLTILQNEQAGASLSKKIDGFMQAAPHNIKQAVEPYGYFRSTVESRLVEQGGKPVAYFAVNLGPTLKIAHVDLEISGPGKDNVELQKIIQHFPITAGQVFEAEKYDAAKQTLFQEANNQGYLKAAFENKMVSIDLDKYTADIVLHLETGPRFYFGDVHFQQSIFSDAFLERFQNFKPGEPYSSAKLLTFQQNLTNSHYFQDASVSPQLLTAKNYQVPIDVRLNPNKSQVYNAGIGYGTYTGPRLTLGTEFRHLTRNGHTFKAQLKVSRVLSGLNAQYIIPGHNPLTDHYAIGANIQRFLPKNGQSTSESISIGSIKKIWGFKRTISLAYLHERSYITDEDTTQNSFLLIPSLNLARIHADNQINPNKGYSVSLDLRGASQQILSKTSFLQTEIKAKYIFSPTNASHVVLRGDLGYTVVRDLNVLPLSLQFFAGGLDSVRGFPYSYFGPGRYIKTASVELQHRIFGDWSGAVFYDLGTADNNWHTPLGHGTGLGLIYHSIIGPVRLYGGYGSLVGKPRHFDVEFSIGPELG
jgi:translocation and assembly module TamA